MIKCAAAFLFGSVSAGTAVDFRAKFGRTQRRGLKSKRQLYQSSRAGNRHYSNYGKLNQQWRNQDTWQEPPIKQAENNETPVLGAAFGEDPREFVRASLNIMRAVYTTIEEVQATPPRRLRLQSNEPSFKEQRHSEEMSLTHILDYKLSQQKKEAREMELDEFIRITDLAEKRLKAGEPNSIPEITNEDDGRSFQLLNTSITGKSHGMFERITDDDGQKRWIWHSLEHCPQEWHILDSPDPKSEMMVFNNRKHKISVIAFRGSESEITDWKTNFDAFKGQLHMTSSTNENDFMSVAGHEGFIKAFDRNRGWLRHALYKHVPEDYKIVVTGHSQGAALAYIGALVTTVEFGRNVSAVIPFASPKLGKSDLNALYEEKVGCHKTLHYFANYDPVPKVPFSMDRPCEEINEHQLQCEFNIWHFWKCHYSETYQHEIRELIKQDGSVHWDAGCERN